MFQKFIHFVKYHSAFNFIIGAVFLVAVSALLMATPVFAQADKNAALVKDGVVINVIVLPDGWPNVENAWKPPAGHEVIFSNEAGPGDTYANGKFTRPLHPSAQKLPENVGILTATGWTTG